MPIERVFPCFLRLAIGAITLICLAAHASPPSKRGDQRQHYRNAMDAIDHGQPDAWKRFAVDLTDYPLLPYIEMALLKRGKGKPSLVQVSAFVKRWPDTLVARELRESTLRDLAKSNDWTNFNALWTDSDSADLRCSRQLARIAAGEKPDYAKDIATLWMQPRPTPASCDPLFGWARQNGQLTDANIWSRIEGAAQAANPATVSSAASLLDPADRIAAERIAASVRDPGVVLGKAASWPDTPRNRDAISYGLLRHARRNSSAAETLWADLGDRFKWDAAQKDRVLNAIAVYRSTSYEADALARLKALPAEAEDDVSREWRVRVALALSDWNETLVALDRMSDTQKADARWRYLRARVLTRLDRKAEAEPIFADVAREANFHGFLAADWIGQPYAICPLTITADKVAEQAVADQADLARALEFHALGDLHNARREWNFAMQKLSADERRLAADFAYRNDWFDRAVFLLSASPDTLAYYEQRFPLAERSHVVRSSRDGGVDPAWAYAIIRAESAWMSDARSAADAYGLMQLLPSVGKKVANAAKLPYSKPSDLFDPDLNIRLGTLFLGQMARQYSGSPWLASAAYNAGGAPVGRWLAERSAMDPDFFIETIPYKETREYVARVLAFSVIYDWRLNQKVIPLAARMPKYGQAYAPPKDDASRKAVVCPSLSSRLTQDSAGE
ncbi:MAG TPA: transglycosylase SLT domain-containing protein [Dokdonella sp.]|uniref:transglycosylase SLT domain-containing protein n=1 Tax=Dokdonella sp. TaxID=2291710 RepID=UPI002CD1FD52|nr:transglycosylase SLT domain-containing protein [Dokdonella sp.]HPG93954.1 transglycosylase SLT domain-containing protein [Dokdonella sp.]HPN78982.1 transglycosylase SLT domain-containing protein [Dokdonella sp.]